MKLKFLSWLCLGLMLLLAALTIIFSLSGCTAYAIPHDVTTVEIQRPSVVVRHIHNQHCGHTSSHHRQHRVTHHRRDHRDHTAIHYRHNHRDHRTTHYRRDHQDHRGTRQHRRDSNNHRTTRRPNRHHRRPRH